MKVFNWYRKPDGENYEPEKIPPYYGDAFGDYENVPNVDLPLTHTQYNMMQQWAEGNFETGAPQADTAFEDLSPEQQADALTRAPLEECLGGPFHPGIEITWPFRNLIFWQSPYRIKVLPGPLDGSGPGSLTCWLGVPWQTDEASCLSGYNTTLYLMLPSFWAARVPNHVMSEQSFMRVSDATLNDAQKLKHFDYRQDWLRDFGTQYVPKINRMVKRWHELGIVVSHPLPADSRNKWLPEQLWIESDRKAFNSDDPTFEQVKHAEGADKKAQENAVLLLDAVAGRVAVTERPTRPRRTFRRDEM
jgi:hypothetical protein